MLSLVLVLILVVVPIVEIAVAVQVGQAIGVLPTLLLLCAFSLLGAVLIRHEGAKAWRRLNEAIEERRPPTAEVLDGALVLAGGTLMLVPGFVSDFFGLVLILPPTRALCRALAMWRIRRRVAVDPVLGPLATQWAAPPRRDGRVIDVEVLDPDHQAPGAKQPTRSEPPAPGGQVMDVEVIRTPAPAPSPPPPPPREPSATHGGEQSPPATAPPSQSPTHDRSDEPGRST